MRRKTLLTAVIIAVALVGCNKAGAEVPPTTEEELASTSIEETSYTKTVEEITSTEEVATTTTIAPTEPTITSTSEEIVPTTIEEKTTSTKEVTSTEIETTTVAPTETSGEGIIEAETSTKEPEKNTTVAQTETTVVATTTVAPTTTEAPTTTVAPVTTEAETTTAAPVTNEVPTTTEAPTTEVPTTEPETTTHVHQYEDGKCGWWPCTICGEYALVTKPLPTENCPYTLNTKIYNDDGSIWFFYVDSNATDEKYGYNDGGAGNRAANDFSNWCELNYYDIAGDGYIGDYAEGVISMIAAHPY